MALSQATVFVVVLVVVAFVASDTDLCPRRNCKCSCCFIPIPDRCDKFCFCSGVSSGFSAEVKCPEGEAFDPSLSICLDKEDVECHRPPPSGINCAPYKEALFAHPKKCDLFVQCSNGIEYIQTCPSGLHFSSTYNRCEDPQVANCNYGLVGDLLCLNDHFYPDENSCSRFFHCSKGKLYLKECPIGLHWCSHCPVPRCEFPNVANCSAKPPVVFSPATVKKNRVRVSSPLFQKSPSDTREVFDCPIPDGVYSVPAKPSLYLRCSGAQGAFYKCPPGQIFHQDSNSCIHNAPADANVFLSEEMCQSYANYNFGR